MNTVKIRSVNDNGNIFEETFNVPAGEKFSIRSMKEFYMKHAGVIPEKTDRVEYIEVDGIDKTNKLLKSRHKSVLYFEDAVKYLKNQMDCNKEARSRTLKEARKSVKSMAISFSIEKESDLLDYLDSVPNKTKYIKSLIREDMKNRRYHNV